MQLQAHKLSDAVPAGIEVNDWGPELTLIRRWSVPFPWHTAFFGAAWILFVVVWSAIAVTDHRQGKLGIAWWLPLVAVIPHSIVGVCLAYYVACCLINRTVITIAKDNLSIRHGPVPLLLCRNYSTEHFQQLFCREVKRSHKGWVRVTYDLMAWNRDDSFDVLLTGFEDLAQAHFLERRIEQYLGLTKERVPPGFVLRPPVANSAA